MDGGGTSGTSSPAPQSLPRVTHVAGDVPPTMSPLDVFAMQSRLLAKQLEDSRKDGRRASRLPPLAVADSLAKQRPGYFRALSTQTGGIVNSDRAQTGPEDGPGNRMEIESPAFRPKSFYPRMSGVPSIRNGHSPMPSPLAHNEIYSTPTEYHHPRANGDYFGTECTQSPDSFALPRRSMESAQRSSTDKSQESSLGSLHRTTELTRDLSIESTSSRGRYSRSLLPPNPTYAQQTPSLRSVPMDSSDDEHQVSTPGSSISQQRKFSTSSVKSQPQSPLTPFTAAHMRSPSAHSERSLSGRPTFNFSRPLSRSNRPSTEFTSRQASSDSQPSMDYPSRQTSCDGRPSMELSFGLPSSDSQIQIFGEDGLQTPASFDNEEFFDSKERQNPVVPSYIYAKYSLPRGRMLGRDSLPLDEMMPSFEWEESKMQNKTTPIASAPPESNLLLPTPPHSIDSDRPIFDTQKRESTESSRSKTNPRTFERVSADSNGIRPSLEAPERASEEVAESIPTRPPPIPNSGDQHRRSMTSMNSGSTIKAPQRVPSTIADMTADEHLNKGIDCHERGALKESTYHLRLAARRNNPTAMLLYALACRHGWGMRQNPQEGVQWLRKAMDCASIELEYDGDTANRGRQGDITERKTRRAQFALSVYELGISHMNGWGTEQDKALALRCFEIASDWGDADAMAEAGFCYAKGVGCKKDLKKAARYYRKAEAKGMSMVGNSWYMSPPVSSTTTADTISCRIYKPKYADDTDATSEKESRDKSRTRTLFGRKKSVVV